MRILLNFLMALDRVTGLLLKPALLFLLVELVMILLGFKGFDFTYDIPQCN